MRLRALALPPEHGGWGLLLEPIVIGLVAAPSRAGALVALAATGVFLSRQPLKVLLLDIAAGRRAARTRAAALLALCYLAAAAAAATFASQRVGPAFLLPAACAAPFALVQLAFDARNESRRVLPEICGAGALAASAAAIAIAYGWHVWFAMALWGVAAARTIPAIVTVRTRVKRLHGETASATPPLIAHAVFMTLVFRLQTLGLAPRGVLALLSLLAARAGFTLRASAPRVRARQIGLEELFVGLVAASALGYLARR